MFKSNKLLGILICFYMLTYPPFLSDAFVPIYLRITLEIILLGYLSAKMFLSGKINHWIVFLLAMYCFGFLLLASDLRTYLSSLNKILFLVLLISILRYKFYLTIDLKNYWIIIWNTLSILTIIAFLGYEFNIIKFSYFPFAEVVEGASYSYYFNPIFGVVILKEFFGFTVARVAGYMFEPMLLAFFFGFNVLIAKHIFDNDKSREYFVWLNAIAGIFTFSMTYIFFIIVYMIGTTLNKLFTKNKLLNLFLVSVIILLLLMNSNTVINLLEFSSANERLLRVEQGLPLIGNNMVTLLFGNGGGFAGKEVGLGISSGMLSTLVEKGLIILVFTVLLLIKYSKHNLTLLLYIFYYSASLEFFWYPLFGVGMAMAYAIYFHNKHKTPVMVYG